MPTASCVSLHCFSWGFFFVLTKKKKSAYKTCLIQAWLKAGMFAADTHGNSSKLKSLSLQRQHYQFGTVSPQGCWCCSSHSFTLRWQRQLSQNNWNTGGASFTVFLIKHLQQLHLLYQNPKKTASDWCLSIAPPTTNIKIFDTNIFCFSFEVKC